jgi:hypothetical protein
VESVSPAYFLFFVAFSAVFTAVGGFIPQAIRFPSVLPVPAGLFIPLSIICQEVSLRSLKNCFEKVRGRKGEMKKTYPYSDE